jgi:ATP-binding cassette subfamily B protein
LPGSEEVSFEPGEDVVASGEIPKCVYLLTEGKARLLAQGNGILSLEILNPGSLPGIFSIATGTPYEWVRASSRVKAWRIPAGNVRDLCRALPSWHDSLRNRVSAGELFPLIAGLLRSRGLPQAAALPVTLGLLPETRLLPTGSSRGDDSGSVAASGDSMIRLESSAGRVLAVPGGLLESLIRVHLEKDPGQRSLTDSSEVAQTQVAPVAHPSVSDRHASHFPFHGAVTSSPVDAVKACLRMLAGQLDLPYREEVIRQALQSVPEGGPVPSLTRIGAVADLMGIATQPLLLPQHSLSDQEAPFLMVLGEVPVVVQAVSRHSLMIADPTAPSASEGQHWVDLKNLTPAGERGYPVLLTRRSRPPLEEAFGFGTFLPYLRRHLRTFVEVIVASFFIQVFALANPMIIQVIIDKVIVQENLNTLDVLAGLLVICTVFGAALSAIRTFLFTDATNRIDLSLGMKVLEHLYRLPLSYFHQRPVGEVSSRLRELDKIRSFMTGTALTAVLDSLFSVVYIAIMLFYSMELTVISLIGVPLLVALTLGVTPIIRRQISARAEKAAATESHLVESLTGIQTIKGQNIETRSRWKWYQFNGEMIAASFRNTITSTGAGTIGTLINRFNDVAVLWVGVYMIIDQKLSLGQLIAFRILAGYVTGPLLRLAQSWQGFQEAKLSVNRLGDVLNRPREDQGSEDQIPISAIRGDVSCRDLDFGYGIGKLQLEHVSLDVPAGSLVALVGLSGSGKSTLLKLIARLYEPVKGSVEIDGFNLSKVELNSLRRQIGMVFQETLLMSGTVFQNIAITDPEAQSSAVIEAARLAEAHDFIMKLSNGYATPVGEQGRNLSGGQRQRIALSRLIMQSPNLLLLDEATSALDAPTERRVLLNLRRHFQGKTIFFATHRLSSVRLADQIIYMDQGLVKERGTHEQLMAKRGLYYALSLQQDTIA